MIPSPPVQDLKQRLVLLALAGLFTASAPGGEKAAVLKVSPSAALHKSKEAIIRGQAFLIELFDPQLNLLPEFRGSKSYWLFHDNYLAAHMLAEQKPEMSRQIRATLAKFGVTNSGKIEIVFNEAPEPLPFRAHQLTEVTILKGKRIRTEFVTTNLLVDWRRYADLLLLAAIAQAKSASTDARSSFDEGIAMWDGQGFNDRAAKSMGTYSTYKLALFLIAADRLRLAPPQCDEVLERLLSLQATDGGWITDYHDGHPVGMANVETTCLALLALQAQLP